MNRRRAGKLIAAGVLGWGFSRAHPAPLRLIELARLETVWAYHEFEFDAQECLLVRVPTPEKPGPRVLSVQGSALSAYALRCTHAGCIVALPDRERLLDCGCHGSLFYAQDGTVRSGPARFPLRAVRLEVREGVVFAVGWLES